MLCVEEEEEEEEEAVTLLFLFLLNVDETRLWEANLLKLGQTFLKHSSLMQYMLKILRKL